MTKLYSRCIPQMELLPNNAPIFLPPTLLPGNPYQKWGNCTLSLKDLWMHKRLTCPPPGGGQDSDQAYGASICLNLERKRQVRLCQDWQILQVSLQLLLAFGQQACHPSSSPSCSASAISKSPQNKQQMNEISKSVYP